MSEEGVEETGLLSERELKALHDSMWLVSTGRVNQLVLELGDRDAIVYRINNRTLRVDIVVRDGVRD